MELNASRWLYGVGIGFIILNTILIGLEFYWLPLLPVILLIGYLTIFKFDLLFFLIVFMVPLSINMDDIGLGYGISLPSEPLILLLLLLFLFKSGIKGTYDSNILRHPITISVFIYLGWMFFTSVTSTLPLISFKFFLSHFWFIVIFYFIGALLFRKIKNIKLFIWMFCFPLAIAITHTLLNHAAEGFSQEASYSVMEPFFIEHGMYASVIAFFIPILAIFFIFGESLRIPIWMRVLALGLVGLFVIGIVYSYTRAAWISLAGTFAAMVVFIFRIKVSVILLALLLLFGTYKVLEDEITYQMSKNKQTTTDSFEKQIKSIYNISTDMSNLERINRWMSAIRMFGDRPILGFGPGTYEFNYAPFQHSSELTGISTNFGDGGNAHSEYLNPLAESGFMGFASFLGVIIITILTGMKLIYESADRRIRILSYGILLGLITYYIHGFLNNYSNYDKAAVPIWAFTAIITALDVYQKKKGSEEEEPEFIESE